MRIVAEYSFNKGAETVRKKYPKLLSEIKEVIGSLDAEGHRTKESKEKPKNKRMLFNPKALNKVFKKEFEKRGWRPKKEFCDYSTSYYVTGYKPTILRGQRPYREMDFLKGKLGVKVQFGKYAFMVYNVCAKMTIFRNLGHIDCGVEIVPVRGFTREMSTGVAYFEQFTWDLEKRGVGSVDIPVLILGIDADIIIDTSAIENGTVRESSELLQEASGLEGETSRPVSKR
jgi:hypothetical protein